MKMYLRTGLSGVALAAALAVPAFAGDLYQPAGSGGFKDAPAETCDWFQNYVVGTRCAQSFAAYAGLTYRSYGYTNSTLNGTDDYYALDGKISVTPNRWLTLYYNSQYNFEDANWTYKGKSYSSNTSYAARQNLGANANLIDTGPGAQRFIVSAYAGGFVTPAHNGYDEDSGGFGGVTANGQWRLGSGYSIAAQGQLEFDGHSLNGNDYLYPQLRLLLSNDKAGIAVGPVFNSGQWIGSNQTIGQSSYYAAGGTLIAQPFRSSQDPFLNGIVVQITGQEFLGQAGFVPSSVEKNSQFDISGTVGFHFRY